MSSEATFNSNVLTWTEVSDQFLPEQIAEKWLIAARWPNGVICPLCETEDVDQVVKSDEQEGNYFECKRKTAHRFSVAEGTLIGHWALSFRDAALLFHLATNRVDDVSRLVLMGLAGIDPEGGRQCLDIIGRIRQESMAPPDSIQIEQGNLAAMDFARLFDERSGHDMPAPINDDPSNLASTVLTARWQPHYCLVEPIGPKGVEELLSSGWSWSNPVVRDLTCREYLSGLPFRLGAAFRHLARISQLNDPFDQFAHLRMCVLLMVSVEEKFRGVLMDDAKIAADMIRDFKNGVAHELEHQTKRSLSLHRSDDAGGYSTLSWAIQESQSNDGIREDRPLNPAFADVTDEVLHNDLIRVLVLLYIEITRRWKVTAFCDYCIGPTPDDFCATCCRKWAKVWRGDKFIEPKKPKREPRMCDRCRSSG